MVLTALTDLLKANTEFLVDGRGVITRHVEPAARGRPVGPEGGDDDVPVDLQRAANGGHVGASIVRRGQEVKDGPVVPEGLSPLGKLELRDVRDDPRHGVGARPEPRLRAIDGELG